MSYDVSKVDFLAQEHDYARRLDGSIETIMDAVKDGLQFPDDVIKMGPAALDLYKVVSEVVDDFMAKNGRSPRTEEVALIVGTLFLMLYRDNRWMKQGVGATTNPE